MDKTEKALYREKRESLSSMVRDGHKDAQGNSTYTYMMDFDEGNVYYENGEGTMMMSPYVADGNAYAMTGEAMPVQKRTVYDPVVKATGKSLDDHLSAEEVGLLKGLLNKVTGRDSMVTIKQFDDEKMIAYDPLYIPPGAIDGHGDSITEEATVKMVAQVKEKIAAGTMKANLFHKVETTAFAWTDAFVSPWPECKVGDQIVVKGQPVIVSQFKSAKAWELKKAGVLKGPSFGGITKSKKVEGSDEA